MNERASVLSIVAAVSLLSSSAAAGQQKSIEPDLTRLAEANALQVLNRSVSALTDGARKGVRLSEGPGEGPAYVQGVELANGTIEFDVRGKDVQGQSFVGVAFHGVDGTTYDAIYFRPFNFRTADSARHIRAVQYIAHPTYTWQKLRTDHPGMYEKPVNPVPDPNGWFHVRVVIAAPKVSVFVDDASQPSLVVNQLSERKKGLVGLWVGNGSGGDFANLTIRSAPQRSSAGEASAGIDSLNARLIHAYRSRDPRTYAALFTDSAVFEWPAFNTVRGRAGLEAMARSNWASLSDMDLQLTVSSRRVVSNHATEFGAFQQSWRDPNAVRMTEFGRYVVLLARQPDSSWQIDRFFGFADSTRPLSTRP